MWLRYSGVALRRVAGPFACHPEYCRLRHRLIGVDHIDLGKRFAGTWFPVARVAGRNPKLEGRARKRKRGGITKTWPESGVRRPEATAGCYKRSEGRIRRRTGKNS